MAIKKRGLGRGLEALLVDVPVTEDISQQPSSSARTFDNDNDALSEKPETLNRLIEETSVEYSSTLIEGFRKENANLLLEAEDLKKLILELTDIIEQL